MDGQRIRWTLVLLLLSVPTLASSEPPEDIADQVDAKLSERRAELQLPELVRRGDLDAAALRMASEIAARSRHQRLETSASVRAFVEQESVEGLAKLTDHVDLQRGAAEPASAIVKRWEGQTKKWAVAMDPETSAVGMATTTTEDGWLVFVAILGQAAESTGPEAVIIPDLLALEKETFLAVNQERLREGKTGLMANEVLSDAARSHSEDMARRHYLATTSPEGQKFDDLLHRWKMGYSHACGNVGTTNNLDDPVPAILNSWMKTRGSRKHILSRRFVMTGVGLAADDEGNLYFTQVFVRP